MDDAEEEEGKRGEGKRRRAGKRGERRDKAWLKEGTQGGEIIDFLDPDVSKKLLCKSAGNVHFILYVIYGI